MDSDLTIEKPDYHCALEQQFKIQVSCSSSVKKNMNSEVLSNFCNRVDTWQHRQMTWKKAREGSDRKRSVRKDWGCSKTAPLRMHNLGNFQQCSAGKRDIWVRSKNSTVLWPVPLPRTVIFCLMNWKSPVPAVESGNNLLHMVYAGWLVSSAVLGNPALPSSCTLLQTYI